MCVYVLHSAREGQGTTFRSRFSPSTLVGSEAQTQIIGLIQQCLFLLCHPPGAYFKFYYECQVCSILGRLRQEIAVSSSPAQNTQQDPISRSAT